MYIAPNSTIKLLTGVPIDKNQSDTLWFASIGAQTAYFNSKVKRSFTLQTYQRLQRGYCRLEVSADQIYDCNYMMFQNTSYGNKWFYAFVNNVEYINDDTAEVRFTIDPIQTWFFDYTLNQAFVERITPASDAVGENILPEPLTMGEYVLNDQYEVVKLPSSDSGDFAKNMCIVVQYVSPEGASGGGGSSEGGIYSGVFSAAQLFVFLADNTTVYAAPGEATGMTDIARLNKFISSQSAHFDAIVGMYMCPLLGFGGSLNPNTFPQLESFTSGGDIYVRKVKPSGVIQITPTMTGITGTETLSGYTPRNKKCYTYPFTFYHVDGPDGQSLVTRYEFFDNLTPSFRVSLNNTYPVEVNLFPINYKGIPSESLEPENEYRPEKLSIKGFPQCSWSMDSYAAWMAQNSVPMLLKGIGSVGAGAMSGLSMGPVGALAGAGIAGFSQIANFFGERYSASIAADITKGSFQTGSNDVSAGRMKFKGGCMTQPYNYIKSFDEFFDAFGYATHEWMTVNIHQRSRWTYVKTAGANVDGSVPADDAKYIADCYDSGIRFWSDTAHPCDYSYAPNGFLT